MVCSTSSAIITNSADISIGKKG